MCAHEDRLVRLACKLFAGIGEAAVTATLTNTGDAMSYMLLIVEPLEQRSERTEQAGRELYDRMNEFAGGLRERGKLLGAESLTSTRDAVRVTVRDGQSRLVDGPFAEAKEMVGGFFLLNVDTREEAVAIAQACPAAAWCTVEVRKLGPCFQ